VKAKLPENAYQLCTNRLFISITVLTSTGLKNQIISEYCSNDDLLEACLASSTIPYITERQMYRTFRGMKVVDGGLTNNTPVFRDGIRRQLVFRLSQVHSLSSPLPAITSLSPHPSCLCGSADRVSLETPHQSRWYVCLSPFHPLLHSLDSCIDALVIRGALQMSRFLSGDYVPSIAWLEERQGERDLIRPGHSIRTIVAPIAVTALILFRQSYLPSLLNFLESVLATGSTVSASPVIRFGDLEAEFQTNSILYFFGMIYATIVSGLRKMQLLL
jgi:hypothetical protein